MTLIVVTATTDPDRARSCIESWGRVPIIGVANGRPASGFGNYTRHTEITCLTVPAYLGTVPAFKLGVDYALGHTDAGVIACLHDDFEILEDGWDAKVLRYFARYPQMGLVGFGGAKGLGDADLYQKPYDPMQLARIGFRSDLVDAEVHGMRSLLAEPVACLDGFSQTGRRAFWEGQIVGRDIHDGSGPYHQWTDHPERPWTVLEKLNVVHHGYDGMLGCLAKRYGWETWYLPLRAKHHGGQTAVGDPGYQEWAKTKHPEGDHGLWKEAHAIWYDSFRDVLPIRT